MKNQTSTETIDSEARKIIDRGSLTDLGDALRHVDRGCAELKVIYRALRDFANDLDGDDLPKAERKDLQAIIDLFEHSQYRLECAMDHASEYLAKLKA
jgi:hypothetical protein